MQKKRKTIAAISGVCLIIVVLIIIFLSKNGTLSKSKAQTEIDTMIRNVLSSYDNPILGDIFKENLCITVDSVSISKLHYTAKCTIQSLDLNAALTEFVESDGKHYPESKYPNPIDRIKAVAQDADTMTATVSIDFEKKDGKLLPVLTDEFINLCEGNLQDFFLRYVG